MFLSLVCLCVCLFVYLSIHGFIIYSLMYLFVFLRSYLFIRVSPWFYFVVCLFVCVFASFT